MTNSGVRDFIVSQFPVPVSPTALQAQPLFKAWYITLIILIKQFSCHIESPQSVHVFHSIILFRGRPSAPAGSTVSFSESPKDTFVWTTLSNLRCVSGAFDNSFCAVFRLFFRTPAVRPQPRRFSPLHIHSLSHSRCLHFCSQTSIPLLDVYIPGFFILCARRTGPACPIPGA